MNHVHFQTCYAAFTSEVSDPPLYRASLLGFPTQYVATRHLKYVFGHRSQRQSLKLDGAYCQLHRSPDPCSSARAKMTTHPLLNGSGADARKFRKRYKVQPVHLDAQHQQVDSSRVNVNKICHLKSCRSPLQSTLSYCFALVPSPFQPLKGRKMYSSGRFTKRAPRSTRT